MTEPKPQQQPSGRGPVQAVIMAFECYALAELVWYTVTDGHQHLHEAAAEKLAELSAVIRYRAQVLDTLRMIRRLPGRDT